MSAKKINLGCGSVFVDSPDWVNFDFSPVTPSVKRANLLKRLPLPDNNVLLVYSSHFLEHVPKKKVSAVLNEIFRILSPGGRVRLVLPDLEEMARSYLALRETNSHSKADFLVLEIVDQCVRGEEGGELGAFYDDLRANSLSLNSSPPQRVSEIAQFVAERTGENLSLDQGDKLQLKYDFDYIFRTVYRKLQKIWILMCLQCLPSAFKEQNVSLAGIGERHHWLWDFHQIKKELQNAGFVDVVRCTSTTSFDGEFPFYPLDINSDGSSRKGDGSLYVEAMKPLK